MWRREHAVAIDPEQHMFRGRYWRRRETCTEGAGGRGSACCYTDGRTGGVGVVSRQGGGDEG